jgi:GntR family histidine utilization transcriptional repressor
MSKIARRPNTLAQSAAAALPAPALAKAAAPASVPEPSMALYQQIKDYISRKIQDGSLRPGHRLPSESELVAQFGMSRMTVNRALRELAEQGRIVRVAGVGSFVAEEKPQSTLLQIADLADEIRRRGHDYRWEVITIERISASMEVATWLDLQMGESVFHAVCVHLENDVPIQLEDRYVNPRVIPDFAKQDFFEMPPSKFLTRNVPYDQMEHVVDAVLPTPEQAEQLAMPVTQPCLQLTRRTWTRGMPVTVVRFLHPASRFRLGSRFRTDGNHISG